MTETNDTLLVKAAKILAGRGATPIKRVPDLIEDRGYTHALVDYEGTRFSLRSKEYRYKDLGSFGLEQVEQAAEQGHTLLSYIDRDESFTVYDAGYLLDEGKTYNQPSQKSVSRTWVEVPAENGVSLSEFVYGKKPTTLAGENATLGGFS